MPYTSEIDFSMWLPVTTVSTLALTYVNNYMNQFHGHKRANSMVLTGKNKQNQSKCGKSR